MIKAVFLDRDGLINKSAQPHDYIKHWDEFTFLPGVTAALKLLHDSGYALIVITNQRGIARGIMTLEDVNSIHKNMCTSVLQSGGVISGIYMCPHEEGTCKCRKPDIGLFLQAERDFNIDKSSSWMVGDSDSDVEAGKRYGVRTIKTTDLMSAAKKILENS